MTLLPRVYEAHRSSSPRILLKIRNGQQSVIAQLNVIEERLEKLSSLEDSTDEIKADLAEFKGMRAEVQSLKESVDVKK